MTKTTVQNNRIQDISFICKDLLKVIKIVSMYPPNNPLPQSMKQSFAERLVNLVEQYGQIAISVKKDTLSYENEVVFQDRSKEESLAGIFFDTGIMDFVFKEGMEVEDVYKLLETVKNYLNSPQKSQDLAAQIWEADVKGFTFTTVEDIALSEYDDNFNLQEYIQVNGSSQTGTGQFATDDAEGYQSIFKRRQEVNEVRLEDGSEKGIGTAGQTVRGASGQATFYMVGEGESSSTVFDGEGADSISQAATEAAKAMGFDDVSVGSAPSPDTALILNEEFKLSAEEEKAVNALVCDDAEFDMYESTTEILKEMLHQEVEMNGFYETVTICERVIMEFVQAGQLTWASRLLQYLKQLEGKIRRERPLWAERLKDAHITTGSRDRLKVLSDALNNFPELTRDELKQYLDIFGWETLSGMTDMLGELDHRSHREELCTFLSTIGKQHPDIVSKGLFDKRWYVVRNSVGILINIGDDKSLEYLKHALKHEEQRVRLELVRGVRNNASMKALELLRQLAVDPDPDIRKEALDSIVTRCSRAAFETVAALINEEGFTSLEPDNQKELLKAFSILGGDAAVSYLSHLILKYNPFRNPALTFYRRAAFEALSYNRSEIGQQLIVKLTSSWRPAIRRQATIALRRHRDMVYGGG